MNSNSTISFHNGVKIDIHSFQADTGASMAALIAGLKDTQGANKGILNVTGTNNSTLAFQSGAESSAFININTINVMTGSGGTTGGSAAEMTNLGSAIDSPTGLTGLSSNQADLATWQSQFKKTAALIDTALDWVSTQRSVYGAQMNRLGFISSNLTAGSTNLQNSRSAIMDTDFAAETAKLTKGQIMQQAATAMLAQANQMPNVILSLLK
jgi:flagellin